MKVKLTILALLSVLLVANAALIASAQPGQLTNNEAHEIARDAYIYAYPLVLMDLTRKVQTNTEIPDTKTKHAPMNQFYHAPDFTDVVRANADTLYSFLWFDVSKEPLVIDVPDSGGR